MTNSTNASTLRRAVSSSSFPHTDCGRTLAPVELRLPSPDGCPVPFTTEEEFDCVVDASIPAEQIDKFYQTVQGAIDDNCENIAVRNFENFYTEDLVINNDVKRIYSLPSEGACIIGSAHNIDRDDLDLRGVCWLHPGGDGSQPLFTIDHDMNSLWIRNAVLDGGGVRRAGVLPLNLKKFITHFALNYSVVNLFNYAAIIMKQVTNIEVTHNRFQDNFGRSLDVRYSGIARILENSLVNCRGTGDSKGVPLLRIVASNIVSFGGLVFTLDQVSSCSNESREAFGNLPCTFHGNVQTRDVDVTDDDFSDVCFSIQGGAIDSLEIFDNVCYKAGVGMQLRQIASISSASLPLLLSQNAMIRPSNFRTTAKENKVRDWNYDEYLTTTSPFFFVPFVTRSCNFPCSLPAAQFPVCTVNPNFFYGYVGAVGQTYSVYGQKSLSGLGFGVFPNASLALDFCDITRTNPYTGNIERPIYFTGHQGGRMFRDVFNVTKAGVSFYGALLPNESFVPPACFHRSEIYGDGWLILGDNFTSMNMSYRRDNRAMDIDNHMFSTIPDTQPIYNVNFTNCTFSGGNLMPYSGNQILRIVTAIDEDRYIAQNRQRGGRRPKALINQPKSLVIVHKCIFEDFSTFDSNLVDPDDHQVFNTTIDQFQATDPIYLQSLNRNANSSMVVITNCTFYNIDHRAIDTRYISVTIIAGNIFANLGGRSQGNPAGILIMGSDVNPSNLTFSDNLIYQLRPILSDKTNSRINPGYYAHVWIAGYLDGSIVCIYNITISDGAIGLRLSGMNQTTVDSCVNNTLLPGFFDDGLDFLRRIYYYNPNITGYVQCIVYGNPHDDFFNTWLFCCNLCVPGNFDACNVSLTNPKYNPTNPFYNTILFDDPDLALRNCTHPSQRVRFLLNNPVTLPYSFALPIDLPAGHVALNTTTNTTVHAFAEELSNNSVPVVIQDCNIQFVKGRFIFEGFDFQHNCGAAQCTWNFNSADPSPLPRKLTLLSNDFFGNNGVTGALCGIVDDDWVIGDASLIAGGVGMPFYSTIFHATTRASGRGNTFQGYMGERIVDLTGRNCSTDIKIWFNEWEVCQGACLVVNQTGGMSVDFNYIFNPIATSVVENAGMHLTVCTPVATVPHELDVQWNQVDTDPSIGGYAPVIFPNNGGYITAFWLDPVPNGFMKTTIKHNSGNFSGVCLRIDNKVVTFPIADPQEPARHINLHDANLFCNGQYMVGSVSRGFDLRLLNGPSYDPTVDSDRILYRAFFCNDGCPKISEVQLAILVLIPSVLFALVLVGSILWCLTRGLGNSIYFSGVIGDWIWRNSMRWDQQGVLVRLKKNVRERFYGGSGQ